MLGEDIRGSGFSFDVTVLEGAGSYVVGEETALLACIEGLRGTVSARPPFPAVRGLYGLPTVVNNTETLANIPFIARRGAAGLPRRSARARRPARKLVCFNERFARPGVYEVRFGTPMRELCEQLAGGMRDGRTLQGAADRRPARRHPAGLAARHAVRLRRRSPRVGCMVGHGGIVALRRAHRHARARAPPAALRRRTRAAASASRAGSACAARYEMFDADGAGRPRRASRSCSRRSSSAACARTAAACRRRSAACSPTSPTSWGSPDAASRSTARELEVEPGTTVLEAIRAAGGDVPTLCFDDRQAPFGACRVCLVGVAGARGPIPPARRPAATGMVIDTRDETARRVATAVVELVLSELPERARRRTPSSPQIARSLGVERAALARRDARRRPRRAPPLPRLPARAVHLLRALRARLRRGPGRVRADRDRTRLRLLT